MPGFNPGGYSSGGLGPGGNSQQDSNSRNNSIGSGALQSRGSDYYSAIAQSRAQDEAKARAKAKAEQEETARKARKKQAAKDRAEAQKSIDARKRSAAGVGGRKSAVGFATVGQEIDRVGLLDTFFNHFAGAFPGVDVEAKLDFATNKRAGNKTTFGAGEAVGDIASLLLGVPGAFGAAGKAFDNVAGTKTEIGAAPKTLANGTKPGARGGVGTQASDGKKNSLSDNQTTDTPNTSTKGGGLNDFSDAFGGDNRSVSLGPQTRSSPSVSLGGPVAPKKSPIKSTTSNGSANDDLFELYRKMLGGFFRGSRV